MPDHIHTYVIRLGKTDHVHTSEMHFAATYHRCIHILSKHSDKIFQIDVSQNNKCVAKWLVSNTSISTGRYVCIKQYFETNY